MSTELTNKAASENNTHNNKSLKYLLYLSLGAVGIIYGDIGTSPLYAIKECFSPQHGLPINHNNILGVLSLIFWSLIIIVTIKYHLLIIRLDNEGEGGIMALMELVRPKKGKGVSYLIIITLGLFGASLLYGDGILTPAISVLSAVEGLNVATPFFEPYIIPLTLIILFTLFYFQKRGTSKVGSIFGPITSIWFLTLATLGVSSIIQNPEVLSSVNPVYAVNFFVENKFLGFIVLGSVFLVVTGGEALYADIGHFNHKAIQIAWFFLAMPSLLLNYFGQGALLLRRPETVVNPFYHLAPEWALYPMVVLATMATIIASQAVITGSFSLTQQAVQLGYLPRVRIIHTSESERGQIYIPQVNWLLFIAIVFLVLEFRSSSNIAAAYGVALTTTMLITTVLAFFAMRKIWNWSLPLALIVTVFFLVADVSFFGSNMLKIAHGGWFPLALGLAVYIIMTTWNWGRKLLLEKIQEVTQPIEKFIDEVMSVRVVSTPGTAIYMSSNPKGTPPALVKNLKHNRILHKQIVVLSVIYEKVPHVNAEEAIEIENPTEGFYRVVARYGFMDNANLKQIIEILNKREIKINIEKTTFFLGRELLFVKDTTGLRRFRKKLFVLLSRNSQRATEFFNIPNDKVFEVGSQIEL
ncbi:MAG: potassium transporter Kup [Chlorobi bacterium]|nr:potassium transporter Kup [Chlorobiota bacterium]MCI0715009.1 potassium transporter Kup [Chlorobiota bacterium]